MITTNGFFVISSDNQTTKNWFINGKMSFENEESENIFMDNLENTFKLITTNPIVMPIGMTGDVSLENFNPDNYLT